MAYIVPPTRSAGQIAVYSDWNTSVRDDFITVESRKEVDYFESFNMHSATFNTPGAASIVIATNPLIPDGLTRYRIEFFCPQVTIGNFAGGNALVVSLWDNRTNLGRVGGVNLSANQQVEFPMYVQRELTPSNDVHVFTIRAHVANTTCTFGTGLGGADVNLPMWIRVTRL